MFKEYTILKTDIVEPIIEAGSAVGTEAVSFRQCFFGGSIKTLFTGRQCVFKVDLEVANGNEDNSLLVKRDVQISRIAAYV